MRLHRLMNRTAKEADRERHEFWVVKLLTSLSDKSLRNAASTCVTEPKSVVIECNYADKIWSDTRVKRRVQSLVQQGIAVEKKDYTTTVADRSFTRQQLVVTF